MCRLPRRLRRSCQASELVFRLGRRIRLGKADVPGNHGENVIQIMRNASGEGTD